MALYDAGTLKASIGVAKLTPGLLRICELERDLAIAREERDILKIHRVLSLRIMCFSTYILWGRPLRSRHRNASEQQIVALKLKKANFKVTDICRHLGHARMTYYRRAVPKAIDANVVKLRAVVRHIHADVHATYGSRRMC